MIVLAKKTSLDSILRDVERKQKKAVKRTAKRVTKKIQDEFKNATTDFYKEYKPKSYDRTYSTYALSDNYHGIKSPEFIKNSYIAGIGVNSSNIGKNPYPRADLDWVVDRTWNKRIHGIETIRHKETTPNQMLEKSVKRLAKSKEITKIFNEEMAKES